MRTLPKYLTDGTHKYTLARKETTLPDGRTNVALYERVPKNKLYQYTPDLSFIQGITPVPVMIQIER